MRDTLDTVLCAPPPTATPVLTTRALRLEVAGRALIDGIDLALAPGRTTVVMGANGAGKSQLLRLLHGLIAPTGGAVLWQGRPLDKAARAAQAMVFQRPVLLRRSVLANLRFALAVRGVRGPVRALREVEALARANLTELAHRPARVLSGGEQQRLAVARALSSAPEILFLDEPTASLDPVSTQAIETLIRAARDSGVTVVLVTHDLGQARRLGDDLLFLHAGRLAESGALPGVMDAPRSAPLRAWLDGRLYLDTPQTQFP